MDRLTIDNNMTNGRRRIAIVSKSVVVGYLYLSMIIVASNYPHTTNAFNISEFDNNETSVNNSSESDNINLTTELLTEASTSVDDLFDDTSTVTSLADDTSPSVSKQVIIDNKDIHNFVVDNTNRVNNDHSVVVDYLNEGDSSAVRSVRAGTIEDDSRRSSSNSIPKEPPVEAQGFGHKSHVYKTDVEQISSDVFVPVNLEHLDDAVEAMQGGLCKEHARRVLHGIRTAEVWATKMFDASAKTSQGILAGTFYQLGDFDECISAELSAGNLVDPQIRGQYCLADVSIDSGKTLTSRKDRPRNAMERSRDNATQHIAVCVPASCDVRDVERFLRYVFGASFADSSDHLHVHIPPRRCHHKKFRPFNTLDVLFGCAIVSFLLITLLGTTFHLMRIYKIKSDPKSESGTLEQVISCFSILQNMSKILTCKSGSDLNLDFIGGIKTLAMTVIIVGHSVIFVVSGPVMNEDFYIQATTQVRNSVLLNNPLFVDTFLMLSGFLMCRLLILELEKRKGKINFLVIYIGRWIRLTPAYFVIIGLYSTWLIRLDDGPLWDSYILTERDRCLTSWWTNILYINNYVNTDYLCMFQSWYLSVDTQLFMLAPFIIYPLYRWPKIGQILLGTCTVVSILIPFTITWVQNLDPTLMALIPEVRDLAKNSYFVNIYAKTHMRACSYCFGLLFGYIVHRLQSARLTLSSTVVSWCWLFAVLIGFTSVFTLNVFYQPGYIPNAFAQASYATLHKVGWCLSIGWLIVACVINKGGPVQKFLCWKAWQPFARLTYCAYLMNGLVELHSTASTRSNQYLSDYDLVSKSIVHVVLTFMGSLVLCLIFESPIHGIEKILLRRETKKKEVNQNEIHQEA